MTASQPYQVFTQVSSAKALQVEFLQPEDVVEFTKLSNRSKAEVKNYYYSIRIEIKYFENSTDTVFVQK